MSPGSRVGAFEIVDLLGKGGMGEVYRARDTKLNREVAIKVLPEPFALDADRLMRFEREAQSLAALNHPHIAQVYGVLEDPAALVMEFVDGEDLAQRIARGPIPLDEALAMAEQVAEALEAAHEAGIVHRDLKPANIKVRPDGAVKVLDFGLAKAIAPASSVVPAVTPAGAMENSPTFTSPAMTQMGVIVGTAAYMAPEQARGRPVDKRADIWAFGCVLFEMLTGRPAFAGETITDVLAGVVQREPDWSLLPAATPPRIRGLLQRMLRKDPRQRLRDAGDARLEFEAPGAAFDSAAVGGPSRRPWIIALVAVTGLVAGALLGSSWRPAPGNEQWTASRVGGPRIAWLPRVSPDGRTLAFTALVDGQTQLGVMNPETGDWSLLTRERARGAVVHLAWSRDGSRIYFSRQASEVGSVFAVPAVGGEPRLVLENATNPEPLPDGSLLLVRINAEGRAQLHRYWPDTARLLPLPVDVHVVFVASLRAFADGREAVLFGRPLSAPRTDPLQLLAVDVETGHMRTLAPWLSPVGEPDEVLPVSVSADGDDVLVVTYAANSATLVAIPRDGSGRSKPLFTTTQHIIAAEQTAGGQLYVDQVDRTMEYLSFQTGGGVPDVRASGVPATATPGALSLADGRTIYAVSTSGRFRLLAGRPGEELVPFVDTRDQARAPMVRVDDHFFAFLGGTLEQPVVALASLSDGRVVRRLEGTRGRRVLRLAAAPDGRTLYFAEGGGIWSVPVTDGEPQYVTAGDGVAIDPGGAFLLIQRHVQEGLTIVRRDPRGEERPLVLPAGLSFVRNSLWPSALRGDGRLAVVVGSDDSWFWGPAVYDLNTGRVARVPLDYAGDVEVDLSWDGDRIRGLARRMEGALWRFDRRPVNHP